MEFKQNYDQCNSIIDKNLWKGRRKVKIKFILFFFRKYLIFRNGVKYDDGIIVSHDRPLNPKTKKMILQEIAAKSPDDKDKNKTHQFKDFDNKLVNTDTMKKISGTNFKGLK